MDDKSSFKRDLTHAGIISAVGIGTHQLANKALMAMKKPMVGGIAMGVAGAAGLAGDYAALHMNRKVDKSLFNKQASDNKYLEKIAEILA